MFLVFIKLRIDGNSLDKKRAIKFTMYNDEKVCEFEKYKIKIYKKRKEIYYKHFVFILGLIPLLSLIRTRSTSGQLTFRFNRAPEHYLLLNLLRR